MAWDGKLLAARAMFPGNKRPWLPNPGLSFPCLYTGSVHIPQVMLQIWGHWKLRRVLVLHVQPLRETSSFLDAGLSSWGGSKCPHCAWSPGSRGLASSWSLAFLFLLLQDVALPSWGPCTPSPLKPCPQSLRWGRNPPPSGPMTSRDSVQACSGSGLGSWPGQLATELIWVV